MRLINRKAGVVIGVTVILTFPVTVVSGAGSQKKGEIETRCIVASHKVSVERTGVIGDQRDRSMSQVSPLTMPRGTRPAL